MIDVSAKSLEWGLETINKSLDKLVEKEKMTAEAKSAALENITTATEIIAAENADMVIEAATENIELKLKLFQELEQIVGKQTILASNTSSLSLTSIAGVIKHPERIIGIHFMNPAPL